MAEAISGFFAKVVESSPQLILLFLGVFLFVISGADHLPLTGDSQIPLSSPVKTGLFLIGLFLIAFALWAIFGNEKFHRSKQIEALEKEKSDLEEERKRLTRNKEDLESLISTQDSRIKELQGSIDKAIEVAQAKGYGEIIIALSKVGEVLTDANEKFKPLIDAANWVEIKISTWVKALDSREYQEYGIQESNIKEFREEIIAHLNLLQSNLREMLPDTIPRLCNVPQNTAKNSLAYSKALKFVQSRMERDLAKDQVLSNTAAEQLLLYMETLIERTTA